MTIKSILTVHQSIVELEDITRHFYSDSLNLNTIINVTYDLNINSRNIKKLPVQFDVIGGMFYCNNNDLTSLEGCPRVVGRNCDFSDNNIKNLDFLPIQIGGNLQINNNKIRSLKGISKLQSCKIINLSNNRIREFGIELIFIKDLITVLYDNLDANAVIGFVDALTIIRKYLGQGKSGLLACANELEDAGLGQYAKL